VAADAAPVLAQLTDRVDLRPDGLRVSLTMPLASGGEGTAAPSNGLVLMRCAPLQIRRRGLEMRLVLDDTAPPSRVDQTLLKTVACAYRWADDLLSGRAQSVGDIARREGVSDRYVWRLMRVGFLAPTIVEAIVDGRQPEELTASALTQRLDLPALWQAQEQTLGLAYPTRAVSAEPVHEVDPVASSGRNRRSPSKTVWPTSSSTARVTSGPLHRWP
jgi:hypothetical protein